MKNSIRLLALAAVVAGGIWLWRIWFPDDETRIRRRLLELAEVASFDANEAPLVKLTSAARVALFFTTDAEIDIAPWGYERVVLRGHDELRAAALGARNAVGWLRVRVENVVVTPGPRTDAASVRFTLAGASNRSPEAQLQEMELQMLKRDDGWLIHRARTFDYFKP